MASPPLPPNDLLRHATFLRALGRKLLLDEHAIDDTAQETFAVGLEQGPRDSSRAKGWLAQVFRNTARQDRRRSSRRRQRERIASRGEALQPTVDAVAHRDVMKRVADAVMALPEPYREVVFLRYYDGLPPREIADRLCAPVATVKSRLQRAFAQLRRTLDASDREGASSWRVALAPLTGLDPTGALEGAALLTGGMMTKTKIAVVATIALAVGVGGVALLDLAGDDRDPEGEPKVTLAEVDAPTPPAPDPARSIETDRPDESEADRQRRQVDEALVAIDAEAKKDAPGGGAPGRSATGGVASNHGGTGSLVAGKKLAQLRLENDSLTQVVKWLEVVTGLNIIVDPRVSQDVKDTEITLHLDDVELSTVLNLVASSADLEWSERNNVIVFETR